MLKQKNCFHFFGLLHFYKKISLNFQKLPNWQNIAQSGHLVANDEKQFWFIIKNKLGGVSIKSVRLIK